MPRHPLVGQLLHDGEYEVVEFIGPGGMSDVYRGLDTQLKRKVAIKVLKRDIASSLYWVRRFREEAQTAANLEHPHVVKIYDIQQHDDIHYTVMQYLPQSLTSILKEKKTLTSLEAITILEPIAEALAFVHKRGTVHRDIKPGNIMLDEHHNPVLTDFGIAVRDDSTRFAGSATTGTPEYMSPEQIRGENVDARSDVYSLGIVLYELLTGNVPYHSEEPQAVFYQQIHEPLPEKPLLDNQVPKRVRDILSRALAKSPNDRYQSASALVEEFNDILRDPPTQRPIKARRSIPKMAVIVPAALVVLVALIALFTPKSRRRPMPDPYATVFVYLEDSTEKVDSTKNRLVPFPGEISLSFGRRETTLSVPNAHAIVRLWPDGSDAVSDTASDTLTAVSFDLYHFQEDTAPFLEISASVPYYEANSGRVAPRKGGRDFMILSLSPVAIRCGWCGQKFNYGDTVCRACGRPRTKWPVGKQEPK